MTQVVARVEESLVERVDALVAAGLVESRSEAVRIGLERLASRLERARVGAQIVDGYVRQPQTDDEIAWSDQATREMIAEEPW